MVSGDENGSEEPVVDAIGAVNAISENGATGARHFRLPALETTTRRLLSKNWTTASLCCRDRDQSTEFDGEVYFRSEREAFTVCLLEPA